LDKASGLMDPRRLSWKLLALTVLLVGLAADPVRAQDDPANEPDGLPLEREKLCASLTEEKRRQTEKCKTEEERREDEYQRREKERAEKEKPTHSSFLRWLNIDGLWVPTQLGGTTYGLIGAHLVVANLNRLYFFGPPGVLLILENGSGGRDLHPALTWGFGIHLTDFNMPASRRTVQLYLNLTKCWTVGSYQNGLDMAGLSISWKKD